MINRGRRGWWWCLTEVVQKERGWREKGTGKGRDKNENKRGFKCLYNQRDREEALCSRPFREGDTLKKTETREKGCKESWLLRTEYKRMHTKSRVGRKA